MNAAVGGRESAPDAALVTALDRVAAAFQPAAPVAAPRAPQPEPAPGGEAAPGVRVRVTLQAEAQLKGPRALVVLARARELGAVDDVHPDPEAFERDDFNGEFSFRLDTQTSEVGIEAKLRAAGDVAQIVVGGEVEAERGAETATGARHVRIDLRRLDGLMNLIGELVTARGQLVETAARQENPALEVRREQSSSH